MSQLADNAEAIPDLPDRAFVDSLDADVRPS